MLILEEKLHKTNKNRIAWNKGKTKEEFPQLSNSGAKKGNIPWMAGKHHSQKSRDKMSESHKGQITWMKGKHHTEKANEKNRLAHLGKHFSPQTEFKKGMIPWHRGRKGVYSEQILEAMSNFCKERFKDKRNHPSWKGGITPLEKEIRNSNRYNQWRSDIFKKDNYTCQDCGIRSGNGKAVILNAHHNIKPFAFIFQSNDIKNIEDALNCDEFWDLNNGLTLCEDCHNLTKLGVNTLEKN